MERESSPSSPNLREINQRLDRLEKSDGFSTKSHDNVDTTLNAAKRLIELLQTKQEESLHEIRELTNQTQEMTRVEESENFRIRMWQQYLRKEMFSDTSSVVSQEELELFSGLSDADLSDLGLPDLPASFYSNNSGRKLKLLHEAKIHDCSFHVTFSPQGAYLITATDNEFCVLDFETFNELQILQEIAQEKCSYSINCIQFHPHEDYFIMGSSKHAMHVWSLPQVRTTHHISLDSEPGSCAFSSEDCTFAVGGNNGVVYMIDASSKNSTDWEQIDCFEAHETKITAMCFSREYLVTASKYIHVWSRKQELLHKISPVGATPFVNIVVFHPFEPFFISATTDSNIYVWSTKSFEQIHILSEHNAKLETCQFLSRRNLLFGCSTDQKTYCWNFDNFESFQVLFEGKFCAVDPFSEVMVTSSAKGGLKLYSFDPGG